MYVKHLQEYLDKFTDGKRGNAVSNAKILAEAHGPRSSKTSSVFLYPGSRILELEACGLKLETTTVGLEACSLELEACGLTLETLGA
jgi:hypothetical protein